MDDRTVRSESQADFVPDEPERDPQWPELRAETPEADAIEQRQAAIPDDVDDAPVRVPTDASEADVLEQSRVVPVDDEFDDDA
jgi:hypothetical protein